MHTLIALGAGMLFGIGLILSGMSDPSKVLGFLDLAGRWNPSMAFVMGGAIIMAAIAFQFARSHGTAMLGGPLRLPTSDRVDPRLVFGGLIFGVGWGMGRYRPGPALASLLTGSIKPAVFVGGRLAGMAVFVFFEMPLRILRNRPA
jgi:uncharacterized membrane protein YedE/YeeE